MKSRFRYDAHAPNAYTAMQGLEDYLEACAIPVTLVHLVKLRASQINGCAYCIDMHWKDLRALAESEARLYMLSAWRESALYSAKERAALAWTEAVTLITAGQVPDSVYEEVRPHLADRELGDLTLVIATINAWNRLSVASRLEAGSYVSRLTPIAAGA
jgi:AhpD family alkylhydroperoxidase